MKIDDIEKAEREATEPPWSVNRYVVNADGEEVSAWGRGDLQERLRVIADDADTLGPIIAAMVFGGTADARAIAILRNAAPHLLAVARAAQEHEAAIHAIAVANLADDDRAIEAAFDRRHVAEQAMRAALAALEAA